MMGYYTDENLWKLTNNNPNLDLVKVNAHAKYDQAETKFW